MLDSPSPNVQKYDVAPVEQLLNVTVQGGVQLLLMTLKHAFNGVPGLLRTMTRSTVSLQPRSLLAISLIVKVPASKNVCEGELDVEGLEPSPKDHS